MLLTNNTANYIYVGGYALAPAGGTATVPDASYNSDDILAAQINSMYAAGTIGVSSAPSGFPRGDAFTGVSGGGTADTVTFTPAGTIAATNVQAAIEEVASEAGGGGAFSPTDVRNLVGWWDASDAATITAVGGAVSQWNDKSGSNYHVTQSTAGNKPTTGTRTINGLNTLDFDGGDVLHKTSGTYGEPPFAVYAVIEADTVAAGTRCIIHAGTTGVNDWALLIDANDPGMYAATGGGGGMADVPNQTSVGVPFLLCGRIPGISSGAGAGARMTSRASGVVGNPVTPFWLVYTNVDIGASNSDTLVFDGKIGEILWYGAPISISEDIAIRDYLADKWNVTP